jgi:rhodanese-related sulfurtransferase
MYSATFYRALSLVAGAAALGLVANAVRPNGVALASFAPPTECAGPHDPKAAAELPPADAAGLCGQPGVVIADTRSAGAYAEGHVAGAVHLPCDAGQAGVEALTHFDRAQRIVVYGQTSDDARAVADSLQRRHPDARVQVLAGGFAAWSSAGLACASGPCDECKTAPPAPAQSRAPQSATAASSSAPAPSGQSAITAPAPASGR